MHIKASRITNLTDARYFAAKEVEFLGFNLEEGTEGYLDPMYMKAIREWVQGPLITGEFSRASMPYVREAVDFFGLDAVQLGPGYATQLDQLAGVPILLEAGDEQLADPDFFRKAAPFVSYFLVKTDATEASEDLKKICTGYPVLLQTNARASQLTAMLDALQPAGLSLVGGEEEQVGVKSFDEIEEIFEALGY